MENKPLTFVERFNLLENVIYPKQERQKELAELCGCSYSTVHKWCYDKNRPVNKLIIEKICEFYGATEEELFPKEKN